MLACWTALGNRLEEMAFCDRVLGDGFRRMTEAESQPEKDISSFAGICSLSFLCCGSYLRSWAPLRRYVVKTSIWLSLFQPRELP